MPAARLNRLPHDLSALLSIAAFLFGELRRAVHDMRRERHVCIASAATTPAKCVTCWRNV